MKIPPEIETKIAKAKKLARETGLVDSFNWYVNNILRPTSSESRKRAPLPLATTMCRIEFDGHIASDGEYEAKACLKDEDGQLLFELSYYGYSDSYTPRWATRGPTVDDAVQAFLEGPWVGEFVSHCSELKHQLKLQHETAEKISDAEALERLKKRFGLI